MSPRFQCDGCRRMLPAADLIVGAFTLCLDCIESEVCEECHGKGDGFTYTDEHGADWDDQPCWCCSGAGRYRLPSFLRVQA